MKKFSLTNLGVPPQDLLSSLVEELLPSAWARTGYKLTPQHDAVFHLVFHGIFPDVWEIMMELLASYQVRSRFEDLVNPSLTAIHQLQVADVLVIPFGGGFSMAGWIGSNKLGFAWLIPYYVSHLRRLMLGKLDQTNTEVMVGVERILGRIERMVHAFTCIISRLLQRSLYPQLPLEVSHYVKVFLFEITRLQETYMPDTKRSKFAYLSTGNFLSMLNLEENLRMFGPIRNFWDALDEKAVQRVKQAFLNVNMSSERWLAAVLENVTRDQHLRMLWDRNVGEDKLLDRFARLRIMKVHEKGDIMESQRPFTALFCNSTFFIVFRKGGDRSDMVFMQQISVEPIYTVMGLVFYFEYALISDTPLLEYQSFEGTDTATHCLFLPYLGSQLQINEEEEDDTNEPGNLATILDYESHLVFDGSKFVMPVIWPSDDSRFGMGDNLSGPSDLNLEGSELI
jgi:hypothetical protein